MASTRAITVLVLVSVWARAAAEPEAPAATQARRLFLEAEEHARAGRGAEARAALERSLTLWPQPLTLAALADGEQAAGHLDEAQRLRARALALAEEGQGRAQPRLPGGLLDHVGAVALRPDGHVLAVTVGDTDVLLLDFPSGRTLGRLSASGRISALAYHPDGTLLAAAGERGVTVWDAVFGGPARTLDGHAGPVAALAFAPDGGFLAAADKDGVALWDVGAGRELRRLAGAGGGVAAFALGPGGALLAAAHQDGRVRLWDTRQGRLVRELTAAPKPTVAVAFSSRGDTVAGTSAFESSVELWDAATGKLRHEVKLFWAAGRPLFTPAGDEVVVVDFTQNIGFYGAADGGMTEFMHADHNPYGSGGLAMTRDGRTLIYASGDEISVFTRGTQQGRRLRTSRDVIRAVAWSADGTTLAAGGDGRVRLVDVRGAVSVRTLGDAGPQILSLAFAARPPRLVTGEKGGAVTLWDTSGARVVAQVKGDGPNVPSVAIAPAGDRYAAGCRNSTARVWQTESGLKLQKVQIRSDLAHGVAFSPDGALVASATTYVNGDGPFWGHLTLWDPATGRVRAEKEEADRRPMYAAAFHPDGRTLAVGTSSGITLWDVPALAARQAWDGPAPIVALAYDARGARLAALRSDGDVELWDVAASRRARVVHSAAGPMALALTPDGRTLALGTVSGTVELWDADEGTRRGVVAFPGGDWVAIADDGRVDGPSPDAVVWAVSGRELPGAVGWERAHTRGLLRELGGAASRGLFQTAAVRAGYLGRYEGGVRIVDDGAGITLVLPDGASVPLVYRGDDEFVSPSRDAYLRFEHSNGGRTASAFVRRTPDGRETSVTRVGD
jgi:WD40 repeat protein